MSISPDFPLNPEGRGVFSAAFLLFPFYVTVYDEASDIANNLCTASLKPDVEYVVTEV